MNVKGRVVKSISNYIKTNHSSLFEEWRRSLPESSKEIFSGYINSSSWYLSDEAFIIPIRVMTHIAFKDEKTGARESGKYFAKKTFKGFPGICIKFVSPCSVMNNGCRLLLKSFENCEARIEKKDNHNIKLFITKLADPDTIIENWLAGWIEQALEISGCKTIIVSMPYSFTNGDSYAEIDVFWK